MSAGIRTDASGLYGALQVGAADVMRFGSDNSGQLAGFRNLFINGGCQVQQRASVALTGTAQYGGVDRFQMFANGSGVGGFFGPVVNTNFTSGAAIGTASFATTSGRPWINHKIEAANCRHLNGKTVTVRARVYHSQGSPIIWRIGFNKANAADNFTTETFLGNATMSVANVPTATYTDIIGRYTFGASDCSNGINVLFNPTTDNNYASGAFYIGEFQLEEGSIATPFEQRPIGLELALCQRYYEKGEVVNYVAISGVSNVQTTAFFKATKRTSSPVVTTPGTTPFAHSSSGITEERFTVSCAGAGAFVNTTWTASAEL